MINSICGRCNQLVKGPASKCPCKKKNPKKKSKEERERNKVITSYKWGKFRKQIIERDEEHCQRCFIKYDYNETANLVVHHIKPRLKSLELIFEATNCVTLCRLCNTQLGTKEELDFIFEAKELDVEYSL